MWEVPVKELLPDNVGQKWLPVAQENNVGQKAEVLLLQKRLSTMHGDCALLTCLPLLVTPLLITSIKSFAELETTRPDVEVCVICVRSQSIFHDFCVPNFLSFGPKDDAKTARKFYYYCPRMEGKTFPGLKQSKTSQAMQKEITSGGHPEGIIIQSVVRYYTEEEAPSLTVASH